jgi:GNAT superfamily N-acetyltransferase
VSRSQVLVEDASEDDAEALVEVWSAVLGARREDRVPASEPLQEAVSSLARIATDPDQRLLVARVDGQVAGAVHLTRGPVSPVLAESAVFMWHLNVRDEFRRHGVGRALVDAAVTWAEEKDTAHVLTAASVHSRDANRFMARLGLGQVALVRGATTAALRAKLPVETPAVVRADRRTHRNVGTVLAKRRSMRRAEQARPS